MNTNTVRRAHGPDPMPPLSQFHSASTGLMTGTIVLAQDGEIPVEFLVPGDKVVTRDAGLVPIHSVSRTSGLIRAVSVAAGSLGNTRPDQDLLLPADQTVLIRDWRARAMFARPQAIVPIRDLIDGEFICDCGVQAATLYQLHFDDPHVIYAGGLELSSHHQLAATELRPAA